MLDRDALVRFHEQGFLGPLRLSTMVDSALMARVAAVVEAGSTLTGHGSYARHLDSRLVFDLCTDPAVLAAIRLVLGEDLLLWNSSFWVKRAESAPTPWHQDVHYWPTTLTVTAWVALTDTDESTGCLVVAPGSHLALLPMAVAPEGSLFEYEADPAAVPAGAGQPIPTAAGDFVLLSDRILHRSARHDAVRAAGRDRWALAARFTLPCVRVPPDRLPLFAGQRCVLVSGSDRFAINALAPAPPEPSQTEWTH